MSTNGENVEDAEMAEWDGEKVVTMMDVLQEQQEFEDDANAVLGASDDKNCTYSKGYIKRQAIYACLTCCSDAKLDPSKRAGVCLACSLTCHENHDLIELYTKRNFCCDCGNPKFKHPCQYTPNKPNLNIENIYNQNFSGVYCTCHRPYPDPDGDEEEMIQCIVCEDWLHASHLEATVPSSELYAEMICKACMEKNEFLHDYGKHAVNGDIDVVDISDLIVSSNTCNGDTNNDNGVYSKAELNESKIDVSEEITTGNAQNDTSIIEGTKAHESKYEEHPQSKTTYISGKSDVEIIAEDHQEIQEVSSKGNNENSSESNEEKSDVKSLAENNQAKQEVSDKVDNDENSKESKQAKDTDENLTSENVSHTKSVEYPADQGTLKDTPVVTSETNEESRIGDDDKDNTFAHFPSVENLEQNQVENTQESAASDTNGEQQTNILLDTEFVDDGHEKQGNSAHSNLRSAIDKIEQMEGEEEHVIDKHTTVDEEIKETKRKLSTEETMENISIKKPKLNGSLCLRPRGEQKVFKGATFWPSYFRQKLCTCSECISMYKDLSVLFLIDLEDTVTAYEAIGKEKANGTAFTQYEKGLEALSSLGRTQQINALTEYNKMRDKLLDFLKSFKDRKEIVKEEDIKAFFAGMKPKREPDGVYFCR